MRHKFTLIATLLLIATPALASDVVARLIPQAKTVGKARMTFAFWDIYDATLYAPAGKLQPDAPFALSLRYQRAFSGKDIAARSVQEMRGQGFADDATLAAWQKQMQEIFPDVQAGTVLSAVFIPGESTTFYHGDLSVGRVEDAAFTQWFAAIWLGEKTSEPEMRRQLLGLS